MTVQAPEPPLVEVRAATLGYPEREILRNVDLEVRRGDFLAVVGPNGAGKTTVLRTILGVLRPLRGACVARGTLGYAPQRSVLDPIYPLTSAEVVAMGLLAGVGVREEAAGLVERALAACGAGRLAPALDDLAKTDGLVERALAACGMAAHSRTQFRDLSGGQKQRVLVARALVSEPDVLILDEPTNDLDLRGEHEVMELVRSLHEGGRTVVMVSHMLHVVARYARRIAFIHGGGLVAGDLDGMLTSARLEPLYGMPVVVGEVAGHRAVAPGRPGTSAPPASPAPRAEPPAPARGEAATTSATTAATTPSEPDEASAAAAAPEPDEAAAGLDELRSEARSWRLVAVGLCALACLAIWSGAGERRGRVEALERLNEASRLRADEARESAELVRSLDAQVSAADRDLEALERGRSLAELQTSEARQALERARGERLRADAAAADALAAAEGRLAARGDELAAIGSRLLAAEQARDQAQRARDQAERARVERSDALERDLAALRDQLGAATAAGARAREEAAALRAALDAARADGLARATALTLELERQRGAVAALESQLRLAAERPGAGEPPPLELEPPDPGGS